MEGGAISATSWEVPMKPSSVIVLGAKYSIEYKDNPADVDHECRESLWGQVDYWTSSIRIYDNGRAESEIWETLLHEVLHIIAHHLKMHRLTDADAHDDLDLLALALRDTLFRNGWIRLGG